MAEVTKALMGTLRADIDAALTAVAAKHGVLLQLANGSYSRDGMTGSFKLEVAARHANTAPGTSPAVVKARADYTRYAASIGLQPEWLDKTMNRHGDTFTITGLEPKRQKFPVLVKRGSDGKTVLMTVEEVKLRMEAAARTDAAIGAAKGAAK